MSGSVPEAFGPFAIVRPLGRGGMGEVFLARTPWTDHPVAAVKRLRPDVARVPTFAERFRHEALLAARLVHPNLVQTLDVGEAAGQLYVATELVVGKDTGIVADRLRERGQGGSAAVALRLLIDGLAALAYAHAAREADGTALKLVHRDITPGNLLVGYDGRARVADFGLAKSLLSVASRLTRQGEILGTPHYLAPEVVEGKPARPASDIYGLGAVIYRFLTGVSPYQGNTSEVLMMVLSERPRPLPDLRPDLAPWIVELVEQMLTRDISARPADARRLGESVLARARAEGLLVGRGAVGRWLRDLFFEAHRNETAELNRLKDIAPAAMLNAKGTRVLVPAESSPREAQPPAESEAREAQGGESADLKDNPNWRSWVDSEASDDEETASQSSLQSGDAAAPETELEWPAQDRLGASIPSGSSSEEAPTRTASGLDTPRPLDSGQAAESTLDDVPEDSVSSNPASGTGLISRPRDPTRVPTFSGGRRPSLTLVAGLLAFAVAAGMALGRLAVQLQPTPSRSLAEDSSLVGKEAQIRIDEWRARIEAERPTDPVAWRHLFRAARALSEASLTEVEAHLKALEDHAGAVSPTNVSVSPSAPTTEVSQGFQSKDP